MWHLTPYQGVMNTLPSELICSVVDFLDGISTIRLSATCRSFRNLEGKDLPLPQPNWALFRFIRSLDFDINQGRNVSNSIQKLKSLPHHTFAQFSRLEDLAVRCHFEPPPSKRVGIDLQIAMSEFPDTLTSLVIRSRLASISFDKLPKCLTKLHISAMTSPPSDILSKLPHTITDLDLSSPNPNIVLEDWSQSHMTSLKMGRPFRSTELSYLPIRLSHLSLHLIDYSVEAIKALPRSLVSLEFDIPQSNQDLVLIDPSLAIAELPPSLTSLSIPMACLMTESRTDSVHCQYSGAKYDSTSVALNGTACAPIHLKSLTSLIVSERIPHSHKLEALPQSLVRFETKSNLDWPVLTSNYDFIASIPRNMCHFGAYIEPTDEEALKALPTSLQSLYLLHVQPSFLPSLSLDSLKRLHLLGLESDFKLDDLQYLPKTLQELLVIDFDFSFETGTNPHMWPRHLHTLRVMSRTINLTEQNLDAILPPSLTFLEIPHSRVRPFSCLRRGLVIQSRHLMVNAPTPHISPKQESCQVS